MLLPARPVIRTLLLTVGTLAALSAATAQAQPAITVRIDTPEFGVRIGQPLPRYGAPGVIVAPVPIYGPPPVVYAPYPPVVIAPPPVIYAPPPRVIYAPAPIVYARPSYGAPHGVGYGYRGHHKHYKHYKHHQRGKYGQQHDRRQPYGHVAFEHGDD
jgi:hypothetical protein